MANNLIQEINNFASQLMKILIKILSTYICKKGLTFTIHLTKLMAIL